MDIHADRSAHRDLLRFVACGSVDDGKSTLIGRLIVETGSAPADQMEALERLSRRYGTTGGDIDYALMLDGLEAEREQGITIDVAYRYFESKERCFIVADTPGHEQYTRNMVTGASNAELALLLVDARSGPTRQTMRHSRIAALLGIRRILLVVNKMDLVGFEQQAFEAVQRHYELFAADLGFAEVTAVPASARHGDNVARPGDRMNWYRGPSVLRYLESVEARAAEIDAPARFVVQRVDRSRPDSRSFMGYVASGTLRRGDAVVNCAGQRSSISRISNYLDAFEQAEAGSAATIELSSHIDVGRGDTLAPDDNPMQSSDQIAADVVWLGQKPLLPGRTYLMRMGTQLLPVVATSIRHTVEIESGDKLAAHSLEMNDIALCNLATPAPVGFDPYVVNRATGSFILIDRESAATVGAGMARFALRRATNVKRQAFAIDKTARAHMKAQKPCIVWFTGLSGAGKSTIMNLVEQRLNRRGLHTYALDGDNLRLTLSRDLGFSAADRVENVRRAGEVARLMLDAGLIVLCAFISPFRAERQAIREKVERDEFIEVFVDTPLEVCVARDPKGLYAKARRESLPNLTGFDSPYEPPESPDIRLRTTEGSADDLADYVVSELERLSGARS